MAARSRGVRIEGLLGRPACVRWAVRSQPRRLASVPPSTSRRLFFSAAPTATHGLASEQITSRAFARCSMRRNSPQLAGIPVDPGLDEGHCARRSQGVLDFPDLDSASFGLWGPGWRPICGSDAYFGEFLTRARRTWPSGALPVRWPGVIPESPEHARLTRTEVEEKRDRDRLRALRSLARNRPRLGRRPSLLCRHASRRIRKSDGAGPDRRRPFPLR